MARSAIPEFAGERPLKVFVYGKPHDLLQVEIVNGLKECMQKRGAIFQDKPDKTTNLILAPAVMGEDVPLQRLAYLRLGKKIDRYQAKIACLTTTPSIPADISELESEYLAKVLDVQRYAEVFGRRIALGPLAKVLDIFDGHWDKDGLIRLADERGLSPVVAIGYPQIPRVGCSYALIAEGDQNSRYPKTAYLIGLEQSHPQIGVNKDFYEDLADRFEAQARDRLIIANHTRRDVALPRAIWLESEGPSSIIKYGKLMKKWGMYPPGFPFQHFTSRKKKFFYDRFLQVTGLSYGNISMRAKGKETEYGEFWMSRSGAKKDELKITDVYLVTGLVEGTNTMGKVRIEGEKQGGRVSVDAIEIQKILHRYRQVGATAHGHEWLKNPKTGKPFESFAGFVKVGETYIVCTDEQHLCGSIELGDVTVDAIAQSPEPEKTVVLQKCHGFQALGQNFNELFGRLEPLRPFLTTEIPQN